VAKPISGPKAAFFVSYGEEDYFLDRDLELARAWPDRSPILFDAEDDLYDSAVVEALETPTQDDLPRTVIVDNAQNLKETKAKALRGYVDEKPTNDTSAVLFAIVRGPKLSDLWSHVSEKAIVSERKKLKTWDKNNEVVKYINERAVKFGLTLEQDVADSMCTHTGGDLYRINNEFKKLQLLLDGAGKVSLKHLALVIASTQKVEPHDVVDATFAKNTRVAMNSLSLLYKTMGGDASVPVCSGLMRELQKIIVARHMIDRGQEADVATALDMHPWRCKTFFLPTVRKHSQKDLSGFMSRLCELEINVKGSSASKRTLVELTVLSIAGN
jgi:DNA polymerase III delta subunit